MKRFIYALLIVLLLNQLTLASESTNKNYSIETLSDGSYYVTIIEDTSRQGDKAFRGVVLAGEQRTETKTKTTYYKNSAGKTLWYVRVKGTFTYGNGTSKCIASTPYAESKDTYWNVYNVSGTRSGNTAIATATGKYIVQGTVLDTKEKSVRLTCSSTGVFS